MAAVAQALREKAEAEQALREKKARPTEPDGTHEPLPKEEKEKAKASQPTPTPPKPERKEIPITHVRFGKAKGAALADVSGVELEEALEAGRAGVAKAKGTEPWLAGARAGITAIEEEIKRREDEPALDAPEPGSEG
jgi:hypothetical protein